MMVEFQNILLEVGLVICLYMTIIFILALIRKDNSIVDGFWAIGFIFVAFYSLIQSGEVDLRKMIVTTLVLMWGMRLSFHIMVRNSGKAEDFRYKAWRDSWRFFVLRSFFQIFMLQGLVYADHFSACMVYQFQQRRTARIVGFIRPVDFRHWLPD